MVLVFSHKMNKLQKDGKAGRVKSESIIINGFLILSNSKGHSAQRQGCVWAHEGLRRNRHFPFWLKVAVPGRCSHMFAKMLHDS